MGASGYHGRKSSWDIIPRSAQSCRTTLSSKPPSLQTISVLARYDACLGRHLHQRIAQGACGRKREVKQSLRISRRRVRDFEQLFGARLFDDRNCEEPNRCDSDADLRAVRTVHLSRKIAT